MGKCSLSYNEIRFDVRDPELTHVWVVITAKGDCPIGAQGWHHKVFPASKPTLKIHEEMFNGTDNPVLWSLEAPRDNQR